MNNKKTEMDLAARQLNDVSIYELALKIAKICNWTYDDKFEKMVFVKNGDILSFDWPSLDGMYEAEEWAAENTKARFANDYPLNLAISVLKGDLTPGVSPLIDVDTFDFIHAGVDERIEAFIKTMEEYV